MNPVSDSRRCLHTALKGGEKETSVLGPRSHSFFVYHGGNRETKGEEECILLHAGEPRWVLVNGTALEIAEGLDRGASVEEVASRLASKHGISSEITRRDVLSTANRLRQQGLLQGQSDVVPFSRSPSLGNLFLHITSRCNLRCLHCYAVPRAAPRDMPASALFRMIDQAVDMGAGRVALSGGEPLLHPEIRDVIGHAASSLCVDLLTNGTLLGRDWASFLADLPNVRVQFSLDGSTPRLHDAVRGHGSYDRAMEAIGFLQEAGIRDRISIAATVMRQNVHDLPAIIRLAESLGVPRVRFLPLRRAGRAVEEWGVVGAGLDRGECERLFEEALTFRADGRSAVEVSCGLSGFLLHPLDEPSWDGTWCPVGRSLTVDVNGGAFPCALLMAEEFRLGNAFGQGLAGLLRSRAMARACATVVQRRTRIRACAVCPWRGFCQGGCMGMALERKGTLWEPDPFCETLKGLYTKAFDRILDRMAWAKPRGATRSWT